MFKIENMFKYAVAHNGIDTLADYLMDIAPDRRQVTNPARTAARLTVTHAQDALITAERATYIDADEDGDVWRLCRLRYTGQVDTWGFAIHLASRNGYEDSVLPSGQPVGIPEEALDCACGLYLGDPTAWDNEPLKD